MWLDAKPMNGFIKPVNRQQDVGATNLMVYCLNLIF